jgi:plasmid stabilization system protein ParE
MARYVLTDLAKADVREIASHIRKRSPEAARRVRAELRTAMRRLAQFPGIGHLREDVTDEPVRFWTVYSYLIAYRPDTNPLQILRVVHGARDLGPLFRRKPG